MSFFVKLNEEAITITQPVYIIYKGPLYHQTDISLVINASFYFTDNSDDALKIYNALQSEASEDEFPSTYYSMNSSDLIEVLIDHAEIIAVKPKNILASDKTDLDTESETTNTESATEEDEDIDLSNAKNVLLLLYITDSAKNNPVIKPYSVVITPALQLNYVKSFPRTMLNINSPQQVYNAFVNLLENKIGIKTYSLYYELILAQLIFCEDDTLYRLSGKKTCKLKMKNFKEAIQTLYPIRSLYFENLGKAITEIPFIETKDFSTFDHYLISNYTYFTQIHQQQQEQEEQKNKRKK